jgi:hypothetical protein
VFHQGFFYLRSACPGLVSRFLLPRFAFSRSDSPGVRSSASRYVIFLVWTSIPERTVFCVPGQFQFIHARDLFVCTRSAHPFSGFLVGFWILVKFIGLCREIDSRSALGCWRCGLSPVFFVAAASLHRPDAVLGPRSLDLYTPSCDLLSACASASRPQDAAPGPGPE